MATIPGVIATPAQIEADAQVDRQRIEQEHALRVAQIKEEQASQAAKIERNYAAYVSAVRQQARRQAAAERDPKERFNDVLSAGAGIYQDLDKIENRRTRRALTRRLRSQLKQGEAVDDVLSDNQERLTKHGIDAGGSTHDALKKSLGGYKQAYDDFTAGWPDESGQADELRRRRAARAHQLTAERNRRIDKILAANKAAQKELPSAKRKAKRATQHEQAEQLRAARVRKLRQRAKQQALRGKLGTAAKTALKAPIVARLEFWKTISWLKIAAAPWEPFSSAVAFVYLNIYGFVALVSGGGTFKMKWWEPIALVLVDVVVIFVIGAIVAVIYMFFLPFL